MSRAGFGVWALVSWAGVACAYESKARPPARQEATLVFDKAGGRFLLCGGWLNKKGPEVDKGDHTEYAWTTPTFGVDWAFDLAEKVWVRTEWKSKGPQGHTVAWTPGGDTLWMFARTDEGARFDTCYQLDVRKGEWTSEATKGVTPKARVQALLTADAVGGRLLMWGGHAGMDKPLEEPFHVLDLVKHEWSSVGDKAAPVSGARVHVQDRSRQAFILEPGFEVRRWEFDPVAVKDVEVKGERPHVGGVSAYDAKHHRLVVWGSSLANREPFRQGPPKPRAMAVYVLDLETMKVAEPDFEGRGPSDRSWPAVAIDAEGRKLLLFGGMSHGAGVPGSYDDTYLLDLKSWRWEIVQKDSGRSR